MQVKAHSDEVKAALESACGQITWIRENLVGIELKGDHRHRIPAQLFDLAIEHGSGIHNLIGANICASAFALVRSEFECFVRGAWLHHCASDAEIETFSAKDRIDPTFGELIDAVEQKPGFDSKFLSNVKDSAMKAMHGYTHGGIHQVSRRLDGDYIEPCFEDGALLEVIQFSATMALIAFGQTAALADREDLIVAADALMTGEPADTPAA
ncbi:DUF6988 family protein [Sphingobium sp. Cam5-1]|uniref:DUF6988 family protein n=1 Tax=Sphingobium sp. Cam5-1 TaxID=2789327 RepID=UPI0018AD1EB1|nr:hypothetical protein [Sphingobium sp. Cam5-1]QPI72206.1 hypothetical protein IZV00_09895 [Sphingobium sp. Cam5-1]